jgi:hypothetical protein
MITFKIISTTEEAVELKTRKHFKLYQVHECIQTPRAGYVSETIKTFDLSGTEIGTKQEIKSFYFGFANTAQAEKFADFARYKFPLLDKIPTHCEARLSKRLASPFEVKIRNLSMISGDLLAFFGNAIQKEIDSPKVVEIDDKAAEYEALKKKVKRL